MEIIFLLLLVTLPLAIMLAKNWQYKKSAYYQNTNISYSAIKKDKGQYGEYLIYKKLRPIERIGGRFLFNVYIPTRTGQTTEIDLILICSKGIFVFESKNYNGWIFGNEKNRYWTQVLPAGRGRSHKERFYNPIMQNAAHIKHLKRYIGDYLPVRSMIVFSNECTLKDVTVFDPNISILYLSNVLKVVREKIKTSSDVLNDIEIENLYNKLYFNSQICDDIKERHASNLN